MTIAIIVKSGTGGYYDEGGCDFLVKRIISPHFPIPRINESIDIMESNDSGRTNKNGEVLKEYHQYLVTDVHYWMVDDWISDGEKFGVNIYVIPVGRNIKIKD